MATQSDPCEKTFTAGGTITKFALVKLSAANTVIVTTGVGDADGAVIGVAQNAASTGGAVNVRLLHCAGSLKIVAAKAITAGSRVYTAASGKGTDATTSNTSIGLANSAAGADGDVIEIIPHVLVDATDNTGT